MNVTHTSCRAAAIAGLAIMLLTGIVTGTKAAATEYAVSGILTWSSTNSDTIAGSFSYNPIGNVASVDLTLTSIGGYSQEAGIWNGSAVYSTTGQFVLFSQAGPANLYIVLGSDLAGLPVTETITSLSWIRGYGCEASTTSVTADVSSASEPGSLALFSTALGFISLTGRSRFRRVGARVQRLFGMSSSTASPAAA